MGSTTQVDSVGKTKLKTKSLVNPVNLPTEIEEKEEHIIIEQALNPECAVHHIQSTRRLQRQKDISLSRG